MAGRGGKKVGEAMGETPRPLDYSPPRQQRVRRNRAQATAAALAIFLAGLLVSAWVSGYMFEMTHLRCPC
jgi:hypothetical protein